MRAVCTIDTNDSIAYKPQVLQAFHNVRDRLRELRTPDEHWTGRLSTSALSTATAISALSVCKKTNARSVNAIQRLSEQEPWENPERWQQLIEQGCQWLLRAQNADGGFGDTDRSHSNIATTLLVLAAWELAGWCPQVREQVKAAESYIERQGSWDGLRRRYGKDKTFVVPILTNCAIAGLFPWSAIAALPFEAAALPQAWYRFARMPVVSYAVPALVAIGQAHFHFCPPRNPALRLLRRSTIQRTLRVLTRMQPDSGGYLEATPLTSFVLMSLAAVGNMELPVANRCRKFIVNAVLSDGSWPIDTNLATWVTSLAIKSVCAFENVELDFESTPASKLQFAQPRPVAEQYAPSVILHADRIGEKGNSIVTHHTIEWLLSCQHRIRHPFTGADPGGWGWSDLSGAVPDADDTPAAMLALYDWNEREGDQWPSIQRKVLDSVGLGVNWLLRLQNRDGGWPTFCRGWGTLPFDRSGSDLTAHAIRALDRWSKPHCSATRNKELHTITKSTETKVSRAVEKGFRYLRKTQRSDGSWLPLWFGNQDQPSEENPIYGTARVLLAFGETGRDEDRCARLGLEYLLRSQNSDGSWGGGSGFRYGPSPNASAIEAVESGHPLIQGSVEETAVATQALLVFTSQGFKHDDRGKAAVELSIRWLCKAVDLGWTEMSSPIGFYFAKLWYYEQLYPLVFTANALALALQKADKDD